MEDFDSTKLTWDAVGNRLLVATTCIFLAFAFSLLSEGFLNHYLAAISVAVTIVVIPLTYLWGGTHIHHERQWHWYQPLSGGIRYVIFQALGWSFFALSFLLPAVPWFLAWCYPGLVVRGLTVAGGASAVLSQMFMVTSLLSYKKPKSNGPTTTTDKNTGIHEVEIVNQRFGHLRKYIESESGKLWWKSFLGLQVGLVFVGCGVAVVADLWLMDSVGQHAVLGCFALACIAVSVGLTHGFGGSWRYFAKNWQFVLPNGSYIFIALQTLGWMFFSMASLIFLLQIFGYSDAPPLVTGGVSGLVAEMLLAGSLLNRGSNAPSRCSRNCGGNDVAIETSYETLQGNPGKEDDETGKSKVQQNVTTVPASKEQVLLNEQVTEVSYPLSFTHYAHGVSLFVLLCRLLLVTFIYNSQNVTLFLVALNVALADVFPKTIVALWTIGIVVYPLTFLGAPMTKGTRAVKWFQGHWVFQQIAAYFDLKIIYDDDKPMPLDARYIFGFHPHGIIPLTIGWACLSDLWQSIFPNIHPAALASSVLHVVPFTRDLNQMFGGYAVTRCGFLAALKRERSVVFIPGGQYEMIHSSSRIPVVRLNTRHRGFIKVALQTGSKLVPVFSFGERTIFDNFPTPISWQLKAMKALRANIFFLPYGQFFLSIPRQASIRLAVGKPIDVPVVKNPSDELVNMLRDHYFTELMLLCDKFKERCNASSTTVVCEPPVQHVSKRDWVGKLKELKEKSIQIRRKQKKKKGGGEKDVAQDVAQDVVEEEDPLPLMELEHVSWTNETTFVAGFFVLAFAVILQRSGLNSFVIQQ
jgi:hypothetical protein